MTGMTGNSKCLQHQFSSKAYLRAQIKQQPLSCHYKQQKLDLLQRAKCTYYMVVPQQKPEHPSSQEATLLALAGYVEYRIQHAWHYSVGDTKIPQER